jgi:hypothetical protein
MGSLKLTGFLAWLAWLFVHIWYLIGFRNRLLVLFDWSWSYFTFRRGARLITGGRMEPGAPELSGQHRVPLAPLAPLAIDVQAKPAASLIPSSKGEAEAAGRSG